VESSFWIFGAREPNDLLLDLLQFLLAMSEKIFSQRAGTTAVTGLLMNQPVSILN
jgi:hypothetical protein